MPFLRSCVVFVDATVTGGSFPDRMRLTRFFLDFSWRPMRAPRREPLRPRGIRELADRRPYPWSSSRRSRKQARFGGAHICAPLARVAVECPTNGGRRVEASLAKTLSAGNGRGVPD